MPFIDVVVHLHQHGATVYPCHVISNTGLLSDEQLDDLLAKALNINYEPDKGESLLIFSFDPEKIKEIDVAKLAAEKAP